MAIDETEARRDIEPAHTETDPATGQKTDGAVLRQAVVQTGVGPTSNTLLPNSEEMSLNMGPQHPSTHGVFRELLELDGEVVRKAVPDLGYLHRGVEKIGEYRQYNQFIPWTDRTDYVAAYTGNYAFVHAVEKLMGVEIPERAQYLRVIFSELQRIASHLVWLGTHCMDLGAITVFLYAMRERELILDMFEMQTGARLTYNSMRVGGFPKDIPPGFLEKLDHFIKIMPERIKEYDALLAENPIFLRRVKGVGVMSAEDAIQWGATGPALRGSGVAYEVRKSQPYAVYDRLDFEVPVGTHGDVYDRFLVRMEEMRQSVKLMRQAMEQLPGGPVMTEDLRVALPGKEATMTSIEAMQRHFILVIHGFRAPVGEYYAAIESPKGELGWYIVSTGENHAYRARNRPPSFVNLQALPLLCEGGMVADVIANIGSLDPVFGEVDR